ncbi:isochorismate synthase MenF [Arthrobacter sp. NPDC090010]|uniref:isochorismate synthase n=1 Tax=Arthrobacter sp. NPDC090010 TaxID=3363942 RepID=UPI00381CB9A2
MSSTLTSITVPLGETASEDGLAALLGSPGTPSADFCWIRRGSGLIGFGEAARFEATGPDRFMLGEQWWRSLILEATSIDPLQLPGTGPVAFGSFAFSKTSEFASRLVVPELVVGLRDGLLWATLISLTGSTPTRAQLDESLGRFVPALLRNGALDDASLTGADDENGEALDAVVRPGSLGEQDWMDAVEQGVQRIRQGAVEKIVLARDVLVELPTEVRAPQVLARLSSRYRECWTYRVDDFVGATPEMLIQVVGRTAQARVLAGTLDRRDAATRPESEGELDFAERVLAGSAKQRHEHQIAIDSLVNALEPFSAVTDAHEEPFILELPNVWHLASDVKAELLEAEGHVPSSLALVNALHPTAAVCGTPTLPAGSIIRELEHLDRGPYAGPVGWLDGAGNGEWGIGLRGGLLGGETARLFAGCGVVEGSVPETELAETWAKFRPMLEALGVSV